VLQTLTLKFDGHCPTTRDYDRPTIRKFRDERAIVEISTHDNGTQFYSATVRGHRVDCCTSLKMAIEHAATEAANIQINVVTIRNFQ
jgi:hypothetical protein